MTLAQDVTQQAINEIFGPSFAYLRANKHRVMTDLVMEHMASVLTTRFHFNSPETIMVVDNESNERLSKIIGDARLLANLDDHLSNATLAGFDANPPFMASSHALYNKMDMMSTKYLRSSALTLDAHPISVDMFYKSVVAQWRLYHACPHVLSNQTLRPGGDMPSGPWAEAMMFLWATVIPQRTPIYVTNYSAATQTWSPFQLQRLQRPIVAVPYHPQQYSDGAYIDDLITPSKSYVSTPSPNGCMWVQWSATHGFYVNIDDLWIAHREQNNLNNTSLLWWYRVSVW